MLGRPLFPHEAWWASLGLSDTRCAVPGLAEQWVRVWWGTRVWGTGRWVDTWVGTVVRVRAVLFYCFTVFYSGQWWCQWWCRWRVSGVILAVLSVFVSFSHSRAQ